MPPDSALTHGKGLLSMTRMMRSLEDAVQKSKYKMHEMQDSLTRQLEEIGLDSDEPDLVDLTIQFIGANGLPKMDVIGTADPYFVCKLDNKLTFVSNVIPNTLSPIWNETWRVDNVPPTAVLRIMVRDKDEGSANDDIVGQCETGITPGAKELTIEKMSFAGVSRERGKFWLKIDSKPSTMHDRSNFQYLFDGPIRFTRNFSPTVGLLTSTSTVRGANVDPDTDMLLYSTLKFHIRRVPMFFGDKHQPWNDKYPAAQKIFGSTASCLAVRTTIQAGHKMLYARTATNGFGTLETRPDKKSPLTSLRDSGSREEEPISLKQILQAGGQLSERIKPAVYTYIISSVDDTLRFSETGAAFFVDFASKHALHSNCAPRVRYSGEMHPRPVGGWAKFNELVPDEDVQWELVVDNNSGTYAPDKLVLPIVKECLEFNFGCHLPVEDEKKKKEQFKVVVYDREDERLTQSVAECREYALTVRGVNKDDLEPHLHGEEVTLSHSAVNSPVRQDSTSSAFFSIFQSP